MRSFNFKNSSVKTSDEYNALANPPKKETSKVFQPGLHEVTITKVTDRGEAKDSSWSKIGLELTGAGEKRILTTVLVPHADIMYKGEGGNTLVPFKNLQSLSAALGADLSVENAGSILGELFGNLSALEGRNLKVKIGYRGNHITYSGKNSDGETTFNVTMGNGQQMVGADGSVLTFSSRDAAVAHLETSKIAYEKFPSVLSYEKSSSQASTQNW